MHSSLVSSTMTSYEHIWTTIAALQAALSACLLSQMDRPMTSLFHNQWSSHLLHPPHLLLDLCQSLPESWQCYWVIYLCDISSSVATLGDLNLSSSKDPATLPQRTGTDCLVSMISPPPMCVRWCHILSNTEAVPRSWTGRRTAEEGWSQWSSHWLSDTLGFRSCRYSSP